MNSCEISARFIPFGSQQEWCQGQRFGIKTKQIIKQQIRWCWLQALGAAPLLPSAWSAHNCCQPQATTHPWGDPTSQLPAPSNMQMGQRSNPDHGVTRALQLWGLAQKRMDERLREIQVQLPAPMPAQLAVQGRSALLQDNPKQVLQDTALTTNPSQRPSSVQDL